MPRSAPYIGPGGPCRLKGLTRFDQHPPDLPHYLLVVHMNIVFINVNPFNSLLFEGADPRDPRVRNVACLAGVL